ncbi:protein MMS22-like [Orussus abietinus]|uniref:protein MMS22-like n=1 Tax=Orussus abietinus TaxID=222816 RepID=UPI000C71615B|nr:protein MMS22-like [Orussus abietinus]
MNSGCTFSCSGKVLSNNWNLNKDSLFLSGEMENIFHNLRTIDTKFELFNQVCSMPYMMMNLEHFVSCTEMKLRILMRYETSAGIYNNTNTAISSRTKQVDFYNMRTSICKLIMCIRTWIKSVKWDSETRSTADDLVGKHLDELSCAIKSYLGRFREIPIWTCQSTGSTLGNKCTQPEFHMYHMHLELRWLYVTLSQAQSLCWQLSSNQFEDVSDDSDELRSTIEDLIYISMKLFERVRFEDLQERTPYSCTCVRELWLMLQILAEESVQGSTRKVFWRKVNFILDNALIQNKEAIEGDHLECNYPELFCVWIIYHLALLHGYRKDGIYASRSSPRIDPNYEQLEKILKAYVERGGKVGQRRNAENELCAIITLVYALVGQWWPPRMQVVSSLWDCFHRRLDDSFFVHSSGLWSLSIER